MLNYISWSVFYVKYNGKEVFRDVKFNNWIYFRYVFWGFSDVFNVCSEGFG